MMREQCLLAVRELVAEHLEPPGDDQLLQLDSLTVVLLVEALEDRFGISISAGDLRPERFASVAAIADFVQAKRA